MPDYNMGNLVPPVKFRNLDFNYLPGFAGWILENRLDEYVTRLLKLSREEEIPLLRLFTNYTDAQLIELGKVSARELLEALRDNRVQAYIEESVKKWVSNQLELIDKFQVLAEDIALVSQVRRQVFRLLLEEYAPEIRQFRNTMIEVDRFTTASDMASFNTYFRIHQERTQHLNLQLEAQKQELLEAQELAKMGSFIWDLEGKGNSKYTPGTLQIFGLEKSSNLTEFFKDVHPEDRPKLKYSIDQALRNNGIYECEYRYNRNNQLKHIWSRGLVKFEGDRAVSMKGTVMDVTMRNELLENLKSKTLLLEHRNLELERMNQELESFNYAASHDLQEPLRKIQVFANRIQEDGLSVSPQLQGYLDKINNAASRMQKLIDDLLVFSQATVGESVFEPTNLEELLAESKSILAHRIEETGTEISHTPLPKVKVVPFQFQQLFTNILSNAIKYRKENESPKIWIGSVMVSGQEAGLPVSNGYSKFLKLSVADNGIGFDPQFSERLFDLFGRLHNKDQYSGTGIGLAICKKIVQNHQGHIRAESDGSEGSTFHIYLPEERVIT